MPQTTTRTVDRALDILLCFGENESGLTLTQISERVGMHKSTVHRLLATLEKKRFVQRLDDASYRLGLGLVELGFSVLKTNDIHRQALPYMQRLATEYRENVDLGILDDDSVLYLQVIESTQRVKIASAPGQRLPIHCTATGKVFLAYLPEKQMQTILKSVHRKYPECTATTLAEIQTQLKLIRGRGFAISEQEYEEGINAVAAPILDANQFPVAAMAIVGPAFRLSAERLLELGCPLCETTNALARDMGLTLQFTKR